MCLWIHSTLVCSVQMHKNFSTQPWRQVARSVWILVIFLEFRKWWISKYWQPMAVEKMYIVLAHFLLMGILQKSSLRLNLSWNWPLAMSSCGSVISEGSWKHLQISAFHRQQLKHLKQLNIWKTTKIVQNLSHHNPYRFKITDFLSSRTRNFQRWVICLVEGPSVCQTVLSIKITIQILRNTM